MHVAAVMPKNICPWAVVFCGLASLGACDSSTTVSDVPEARSQKLRLTPAVSEPDRLALSQGNAAFAMNLFATLPKGKDNVVYSPASISVALAMAYAGARGETEAQMKQALSFALPQEGLHPAMNLLDQELKARGQNAKGADGGPFRLKMVNALWAHKENFELQPAFLDVQAEHYGAGVNLVDFVAAPEAARKTINGWVEGQTEKRIKDLIPQGVINGLTRLVLTNAIYLNAAWKMPFSTETSDATFHPLSGSPVNVKMMKLDVLAESVNGSDYQAVSLPYEDERLAMLFVAPKNGAFESFEASLTPQKLAGVVQALQTQPVVLRLPRFSFEYPMSLKQTLTSLGMADAFSSAADFSGVSSSDDLQITDVVHNAFVAVAEKGTEAAAATAVVFGRKASPQGLLIQFDRPFFFFLRDKPTGAILFMGRVMNPAK